MCTTSGEEPSGPLGSGYPEAGMLPRRVSVGSLPMTQMVGYSIAYGVCHSSRNLTKPSIHGRLD